MKRVKKFCFDTETTGFPVNPVNTQPLEMQPRIIQLYGALVEFGEDGSDPVVLDVISTYLNSVNVVPAKITQLTGITSAHLAGAPQWSDVRGRFFELSGMADFTIAHNFPFDARMVWVEEHTLGNDKPFANTKTRCSLEASRRVNKAAMSHSLGNLYTHLFHETMVNAHDAAGDVSGLIRITADLMSKKAWG